MRMRHAHVRMCTRTLAGTLHFTCAHAHRTHMRMFISTLSQSTSPCPHAAADTHTHAQHQTSIVPTALDHDY